MPRIPALRVTIVGELLRGVQLQAQDHAEAVPQRRGELSGPGGGAHQGELGQVDADRPCRRPLADDDIQGKVLHRRIEHLLHAAGEAVNLINKEYVVRRSDW